MDGSRWFWWRCVLQAEDGIRGAQESRGLGDVYKRQIPGSPFTGHAPFSDEIEKLDWLASCGFSVVHTEPVSYTHLTLPTIYSV